MAGKQALIEIASVSPVRAYIRVHTSVSFCVYNEIVVISLHFEGDVAQIITVVYFIFRPGKMKFTPLKKNL